MNDAATIEKLVNDNLKLAYFFAEMYKFRLSRWMDIDEITSNAMFGLYTAAVKFDPNNGGKFSTWASLIIKQMVLRPMAEKKAIKRGGIFADLTQVHLDEVDEDGVNFWHETIPYSETFDIERPDRMDYYTPIMSKILARLKPRHRMIIMMRHGLIDGDPKTLEETASFLGVTRERIRQMERDAMLALKRLMPKETDSVNPPVSPAGEMAESDET